MVVSVIGIGIFAFATGVYYFESRVRIDHITRLRYRIRSTDKRMLTVWMLLRDMERASLRAGAGSKARLSTIEQEIVYQAERLGVAAEVADQMLHTAYE